MMDGGTTEEAPVAGESVANVEKKLSGGDSDHPLTVKGMTLLPCDHGDMLLLLLLLYINTNNYDNIFKVFNAC